MKQFKPTPETQKMVDDYNDAIHAHTQALYDKLKAAGLAEEVLPFVIQIQLMGHLVDLFQAAEPDDHKFMVAHLMNLFQQRFNNLADAMASGEGCGNPDCKNCGAQERMKIEIESDEVMH